MWQQHCVKISMKPSGVHYVNCTAAPRQLFTQLIWQERKKKKDQTDPNNDEKQFYPNKRKLNKRYLRESMSTMLHIIL